MKTLKAIRIPGVPFIIIAMISSLAGDTNAQQAERRLVAQRNLCQVEVRAGNADIVEANPLIFSGSVQQGQAFSTTSTFISVRWDANPGVCGALRNQWFRCSSGTCSFP